MYIGTSLGVNIIFYSKWGYKRKLLNAQKTLPKTNAVASHAKVLLWSIRPGLDEGNTEGCVGPRSQKIIPSRGIEPRPPR